VREAVMMEPAGRQECIVGGVSHVHDADSAQTEFVVPRKIFALGCHWPDAGLRYPSR